MQHGSPSIYFRSKRDPDAPQTTNLIECNLKINEMQNWDWGQACGGLHVFLGRSPN